MLDDASPSTAPLLRRAIELMVDAFLLDRRGNSALFARAHEIGAAVEEQFSCSWQLDEKQHPLENRCGIFAPHSRIGLSPGERTWGTCSIGAAGDFECDQVPGKAYDGEHYGIELARWPRCDYSNLPSTR